MACIYSYMCVFTHIAKRRRDSHNFRDFSRIHTKSKDKSFLDDDLSLHQYMSQLHLANGPFGSDSDQVRFMSSYFGSVSVRVS